MSNMHQWKQLLADVFDEHPVHHTDVDILSEDQSKARLKGHQDRDNTWGVDPEMQVYITADSSEAQEKRDWAAGRGNGPTDAEQELINMSRGYYVNIHRDFERYTQPDKHPKTTDGAKSVLPESTHASIDLDAHSAQPAQDQPVHEPDSADQIRSNFEKMARKLDVQFVDDFDHYVNNTAKTSDGAKSTLPEHVIEESNQAEFSPEIGDRVVVHSPDDWDWHGREGTVIGSTDDSYNLELENGDQLLVGRDQVRKPDSEMHIDESQKLSENLLQKAGERLGAYLGSFARNHPAHKLSRMIIKKFPSVKKGAADFRAMSNETLADYASGLLTMMGNVGQHDMFTSDDDARELERVRRELKTYAKAAQKYRNIAKSQSKPAVAEDSQQPAIDSVMVSVNQHVGDDRSCVAHYRDQQGRSRQVPVTAGNHSIKKFLEHFEQRNPGLELVSITETTTAGGVATAAVPVGSTVRRMSEHTDIQIGDTVTVKPTKTPRRKEISGTVTGFTNKQVIFQDDDKNTYAASPHNLEVLEPATESTHPNSKIYDQCWTGYRKVPGKKRGEPGSCRKETPAERALRTNEVLDPDAPVSDWVDDFQQSDSDQFRGKDKKKRAKMATAAWHAAQRTTESTELDESESSTQALAAKVYQKFNEIGSDMPVDIVSTEDLVDIVVDHLDYETGRAVSDNREAVVAELNKMSGSTSWQFGTDDFELDGFDMPGGIPRDASYEYICVHDEEDQPYRCHAKTSWEAAKKAAEHWGMKSTADIDVQLASKSAQLDEGAREWVLGALVGMGLIGSVAGLSHLDRKAFANDAQLQTLITYYQEAKAEGDREAMRDLKQRIRRQKDRISLGKGPVRDASGTPIVPQRDRTTDARHPVTEAIHELVNSGQPLTENLFRLGSAAYVQVFAEARRLRAKGQLPELDAISEQVLRSDAGRWGTYENQRVPLDIPMIAEAEYQGRDVELNKPKRGGSKAYYVYVRNPDTDNVIKVEFGSGMPAKLNDPEARRNYDQRHGCSAGRHNDKTKPGYWSCRLPRYAKALGLSGSGEWW